MTTTPLHAATLAASREEPDELVHRAALHDLLEESGCTDERLLSACLTGRWVGTLAEWWDQGPDVVAVVCVREEGVRLVDREPACINGPYSWALWFHGQEVLERCDLPNAWWAPSSLTRLVVKWIKYDSPEAAHLDASRRAVRWAMGEAEKREKGEAS